MSTSKLPITVIIHTKNSAVTLERCLKSVEFAEDVIVIDMESTDTTKQIADKFDSTFITVKDEGLGYADPMRNFGLTKAQQDWILVVDSDEEVSEGLQSWIAEFLSDSSKMSDATAFKIPRRNFMFGIEIEHTGWWPDYQIRFFKKGKVQWESKVHTMPKVEGRLIELPADRDIALIHQNYASIEQFVDRMNRYTSATAKESQKDDHRKNYSGEHYIKTFREEFIRRMFQWEGHRDGGVGVSLSLLQSTYQLIVELKRAEIHKFSGNKNDVESTMEEIHRFSNDLKYWYFDWRIKQSSGLSKLFWQMRRKLLK